MKTFILLGMLFCFFAATHSSAMQPPTKKQLEKYKQDGSLAKRIDDAKSKGNHIIAPQLLQRSRQVLNQYLTHPLQNTNAQLSAIPGHLGLPTTGTVKTFTLLIDFSDAPAPSHQSKEVLYNHIYGEGLPERYPYESLKNFYQRSSYDQLTITGDVVGWYRLSKPRAEQDDAREMIKEALTALEQQGHDFSQYDNDGDGYIDYFSVVWTGEIGEWSSLWWGWQSSFNEPEYTLSGKQLAAFSWQWLSGNNATDEFDPLTLIHETGHGLGLPDFYDYDDTVGPQGGTGGLDMMDATLGDHGAFSKFMLGWITPQVVGSSSHDIELAPSSQSKDALIIMPNLTLNDALSEYYVVQHRDRQGNDSHMYNTGLLIWHVDAKANEYGFSNNNSYTEQKLIRLVEADGLEEIEQLLGADADDYFQTGQTFASGTTPSSLGYQAATESVSISSMVITEQSSKIKAEISSLPVFSVLGITEQQIIRQTQPITVQSELDLAKVALYINGELIQEDNNAPFEFSLPYSGLTSGENQVQVNVYTHAQTMNVAQLTVYQFPTEAIPLVVSLQSRESALAISQTLLQLGYNSLSLTDVPALQATDTPVVFIDNTSQSALTATQNEHILSYIRSGGHVYYENFEWFWTSTPEFTDFTAQIGISYGDNWSQDSASLIGHEGSEQFGLSYTPEYKNDYILYTHLTSLDPKAKPIWHVDQLDVDVTLSNQIELGSVIASTARFSEIPASLRGVILTNYLTELSFTKEPAPLAIEFSNNAVSQSEAMDSFEITVTRNIIDANNRDFVLHTEAMDAQENVDFVAIGPVNYQFDEGQLTKTVTVSLIDNQTVDGSRQFKLLLTGENIGEQKELIVTITDNEIRGTIEFNTTAMVVNENQQTMNVEIKRVNGADDTLAYSIKTIDGSAKAGVDYELLETATELQNGVVSHSYTINILDNSVVDGTRQFSITLFSDYLSTEPQVLIVSIENDDVKVIEPPIVVPPKKEESSGGTLYWFIVMLMACAIKRRY
ncbi:hypothetical protein PULV_b0771 [Pseudoalteromonas ulvae UL12]|uniref:M6 family metalloprotease domain-containing protein n=1 Tax=Pseudoalteromonas ulvae TaxID=107327 RepID=UPI00186B6445|nr:M6 family metalloprotease domain-containing protein [Pseudoalteromonas ulvae]MBE0366041.1 hypothetical protein [Pseudoalteromonas ulvae UL12]